MAVWVVMTLHDVSSEHNLAIKNTNKHGGVSVARPGGGEGDGRQGGDARSGGESDDIQGVDDNRYLVFLPIYFAMRGSVV